MKDEIIISGNLDELLERQNNSSDLLIIMRCITGKMQIELNRKLYVVEPNDLLFCRPDAILGHYMHTPDFTCRSLVYTSSSLDKVAYLCFQEDSQWWDKSQYLLTHPIIHLDQRQIELCEAFGNLDRIYHKYEMTPTREKVLKVILQASTCEILSWIAELLEPEDKHLISPKNAIYRKFADLVHQQKGREREVQWYAQQLNISPKHLTSICKSIRGKSAYALIEEVAVQEISRLLLTTDMSIRQISEELCFTNISFFCKYVKTNLGMTANEYRKNMK